MVKANSQVAVIIPCLNEGRAIGRVVSEFRDALPTAEIHVFDNGSQDNTVEEAIQHGATVHKVQKKGKGNVVRAMFRDVSADIYLMTDGDGTYPAGAAPEMISLLQAENADMVVGTRLSNYSKSQSRKGHKFGNQIITKTVNYLFDSEFTDLLSGYRVFSRRFVKTIPIYSSGFEVETTISIHSIDVDAKVLECPIVYSPRFEGTVSKLSTFKDGRLIAWAIFSLFKDYKPFLVYGLFGVSMLCLSLIVGGPVIVDYFETGLVDRLPSATLAASLVIVGFVSFSIGLISSSLSKARREIKRLAFLSIRQ